MRTSSWFTAVAFGAAVAAAACVIWVANGGFLSPARADYQRGESLAAAQLWPEAADAWTEAIRHDPSYVPAYRRLASLFEQQQNLSAAILVWRDCVKHVPGARHAWCRLAEDEAAVGLTAPALKDAERELHQDDSCPAANLVAGQLLARTSLQAEALSRLKRATAAYPANAGLRLLYARLLAQDFHPAEAEAVLRPLVADRATRSPEALYWMAYSLDRSEPPSSGSSDSREAESDLKQALAMQPHYPEAAAELGWLYQTLGRAEDAIPYLRASLADRPHQATVLFTLADALRQSGRTAEAGTVLDRFRRESALNSQEKALQKQYAVTRSVATALQLARVERQLQNEAGAQKVLEEASMDHPGDASIRAFRRDLQSPGKSVPTAATSSDLSRSLSKRIPVAPRDAAAARSGLSR